jgi:hypothetical protein
VRFPSDYVSASSVSVITLMLQPAFITRTNGRSLGTFEPK